MKIGFLSLGCPKNLVDGEVMLGMAREAGHEITSDASDAEVLVVNTCAFIDSAKQESIDAILEMAAQKRDGRCSRLVVTGCLAERYRDELRREIPEIDAVLGTGEVEGIVDAIGSQGSGIRGQGAGIPPAATVPLKFFGKSPRRLGSSNAPVGTLVPGSLIPDPRIANPPIPDRRIPDYLYDADTPRYLTTPKHFAYLKVAEGCDYTCAFCIIPTLRGSYRSRTTDSIVREARALAGRGVRELLLISQDTTFFGIDRGERGALGRLLRELNQIEGLAWIRLLYLYPTTITDDVLSAMAECDKVCRYIDLPLQHASAEVLKRMRRPGNRRTYDALLAKIRVQGAGRDAQDDPDCRVPGRNGGRFCRAGGLRRRYRDSITWASSRIRTRRALRAFGLVDDVPAGVKRQRRNALMARQKKIVARAHRARIGTEAAVLVDGPSAEHEMVLQGRLEGQAPDIDSVVYLTDCDPAAFETGALIQTRVVGARGYDLVAAPLV